MDSRRATPDAASAHPRARSPRLAVERLEYRHAELLLHVVVRVSIDPAANPSPVLLIEQGEVQLCYSPFLACASRISRGDAARFDDDGDWRWRGAFAVPPDPIGDPLADFALRLRGGVVLALPAPVTGQQRAHARSRVRRAAPRRARILLADAASFASVENGFLVRSSGAFGIHNE
jgi:hypothetical protein